MFEIKAGAVGAGEGVKSRLCEALQGPKPSKAHVTPCPICNSNRNTKQQNRYQESNVVLNF